MIKKNAVICFAIIFIGCATSMKDGTTAKLRPDLTDDDTEMWEINSKGNPYTSSETVMQNALKRAALTSDAESFDCFLLIESNSDVKDYTYTEYEKNVVNSSAIRCLESSDYADKSICSYTNRQREVYIPQTRSYNEAYTTIHVIFKKNDECLQIKKTKWRQNVYFNKDFLPANH